MLYIISIRWTTKEIYSKFKWLKFKHLFSQFQLGDHMEVTHQHFHGCSKISGPLKLANRTSHIFRNPGTKISPNRIHFLRRRTRKFKG